MERIGWKGVMALLALPVALRICYISTGVLHLYTYFMIDTPSLSDAKDHLVPVIFIATETTLMILALIWVWRHLRKVA